MRLKIFLSKLTIVLLLIAISACSGWNSPLERRKPSEKLAHETKFDLKMPLSPMAYYHYSLSALAESRGDLNEAIAEIQYAIAYDPRESHLYTTLGNLYLTRASMSYGPQKYANLELARKAAEEALVISPKDISTLKLINNIYSFYDIPPIKELIANNKKILEIDPDNEDTLLSMGLIYLSLQDHHKALDYLKKAIRNNPNLYLGYYYIAEVYLDLMMYEKAIENLQMAVEIEPAFREAQEKLLNIYQLQEKNEKALEVALQLYNYYPDDSSLLIRIGDLYFKLKEIDKFEKIMERMQNDINFGHLATIRLALLKADQGDLVSARDILERGLERFPNKADLIMPKLAQVLIEQKEYEQALVILRKMLEKERKNLELYYLIYRIYRENKDDRQALAIMKEAEQALPDEPAVFFYQGRAYYSLGEYQNALEAYQKALKLDPDSEDILYSIGATLERLGKMDEALEAMEKVLKANPKNPYAKNFIGYTYAERNIHLPTAEKLILEALAEEPENPAFIDSLGWVYYQKKDYVKAVAELERAVSLESEDPLIFEHLGRAYIGLGEIEKAIDALEKALSLNPENRAEIERLINELKENRSAKDAKVK